jgi:very-short-patch-repair endonuclease
MARAKTLTTARVKPVGDRKTGRSTYPGLVFTRVRGLRKDRAFSAAPRQFVSVPTAEEFFEERYTEWAAIWGGTRPEFVVYDYLVNRRKMVNGIDFIYQSSRHGGRNVFGGSVVDFELPLYRLYLRVQGERFHSSPNDFARDRLQEVLLARHGWHVIDIWAESLMAAPYTVMEAALRGQQLAGVIRTD